MALYKQKVKATVKGKDAWLSTLIQNIPDAVVATDLVGKVTYVNPAAESLLGHTSREVMGHLLGEVVKMTSDEGESIFEEPFSERGPRPGIVGYPFEATLVRQAGNLPVETTMALIRTSAHDIEGYLFIFRDQRTRKRAERRMVKAEIAYRAIINAISAPVVLVVKDLSIAFFNRAFEQLVVPNIPGREVASVSISEIFPAVPTLTRESLLQSFQSGRSELHEEQITVGGKDLKIKFKKVPVKERGIVIGLVLIFEGV